MRHSKKIWIAVSVLLILLGILCLTISFGFDGFDISKWHTQSFTTQTHIIENEFEHIDVYSISEDIRLAVSETGKTEIVCSESEKIKYHISVENGTLEISYQDTRKWYEKMDFFWEPETPVTIYLPKNRYGNVNITSISGDISIPSAFYFSNLSLKTTSGDIVNTSVTDRNLSAISTSGDIHIRPSNNLTKMDSLYIKVTTGDIEARGINAAEVSLRVTTGDIEMDHFNVENLTVQTTTGEIEFQALYASGTVEMVTTSGDVEGVVHSLHTFDAKTTSGVVRVPHSERNAPVFKVRATSGDIEIEETDD